MQYLQETNIKILELVERFKYLSTSQIIKLGVASSQPAVSRILQRFFKNKDGDIKSPLINKLTFPLDPKRGKLENLYCLNKRGALYLSEFLDKNLDDIDFLKGNGFFAKDYQHRVSQINFHIDLYLRSFKENFTIDFFHSYFYKIGANNTNSTQKLEAKTKLFCNDNTWFIPDGIYKTSKVLKDDNIQSYFYVLEIHKGKDTKRAIETIDKNIRALVDGSIAKKYDYSYSHKVVVVFDDKKAMESVLNRLDKLEYFFEFRDYFEFKL